MQQEVLMWVITGVSSLTLALVGVVWGEIKGMRITCDKNSVDIARCDARVDAIDGRLDRCTHCK